MTNVQGGELNQKIPCEEGKKRYSPMGRYPLEHSQEKQNKPLGRVGQRWEARCEKERAQAESMNFRRGQISVGIKRKGFSGKKEEEVSQAEKGISM